jgi:hypothetical protein
MVFTTLGHYVAIIALMLGIFSIVWGVLIATGNLPPQAHTWPSGKLIDRGIYTLLFSIVLGILAEIHYSLREPAK